MIIFCIFIILLNVTNNVLSFETKENQKIFDKISKDIELKPLTDYCIKYSLDNMELEEEPIEPYSAGLSEKIKYAIAKTPRWIQRQLTFQFLKIDGEKYADLILQMNKKYVDEIAFIISYSSIGNVPSIDIILDNVLSLYDNDKWIKYADIVDYERSDGNYYSTVRYRVIEDDEVKEFEFPFMIYYWFIVHPSLTGENPQYIYNEFWRDYLINHNDLGYPLLKEKLSDIDYLWDCKSYFQPGDRTWNWSMSNHPTAIEAISYWVGKTVPEWAFGDRPGQPNLIAHQHNGWCGELQKIAVAAQRAALIPSVGIFNRGEDHVWREFYERGWHENDNWWADGGGAVDEPDIYAYGWNKDMSSIHAIKGDHVIYDVTSTYIHPAERKTISFKVLDRALKPVDGARVIVAVKGPTDITWIRNKFFVTLEEIWRKIPDFLKGNILQLLYNKLKERIEEIPDSVEAPIYTIWNFTDVNGISSFELGQNRSYTFYIQYGNLNKPPIPAWHNSIRSLNEPVDKDFVVWFPFLSPLKQKHVNKNIPNGEISFDISFETFSYQVQKCILGQQHEGLYEGKGKVDFFVLDRTNYLKYLDGRDFDCYNFISDSSQKFSIDTNNSDWYFIFRNNCRESNMILDFSISIKSMETRNKVSIVTPNTIIFEKPIMDIGEIITISGTSTADIFLEINEENFDIEMQENEWEYLWDTTGLSPGTYEINAICGDAETNIQVELVDLNPPLIQIDSPVDKSITDFETISIFGHSSDNFELDRIELSIDESNYELTDGKETWSIEWDISGLDLGIHKITAKAIDKSGLISFDSVEFVLNESNHLWGPEINLLYHEPESPTNLSNIIIYANVTDDSPFGIKEVELNWDIGGTTYSKSMFRYADHPVQDRHEEDILKNESNEPIYGLELGQLSVGTIIIYWVKAYDFADNVKISDKNSFTI